MSLSTQTKTKPLVLPTEIASLQDLEAYIRLPAAVPVGRTQMMFKTMSAITDAFVEADLSFISSDQYLGNCANLDIEGVCDMSDGAGQLVGIPDKKSPQDT